MGFLSAPPTPPRFKLCCFLHTINRIKIMTKRDFLLSLSKDELVELIFGFSETNREACDFIQKKIYQAEVLGQNNKQENLLENPKTRNAEVPAAEISAYTNAINRFSSPEEKIALFKSLFSGRKPGFCNL